MSGAWSLWRPAALGVGLAALALALFGREPPGAMVEGVTRCEGRVEVVATAEDCGGGLDGGLVLGRWEGACGPFALELETVGPGVGAVCALQRDGGRVVRAARRLGEDPGTLTLVRVVW